MNSHKGFDRLSAVYDLLVKLIFGHGVKKAQIALIGKAANGKQWLILGGGTGWILEEIFKRYPNATITYVEASQKMIEKAKNRNLKGNVVFVGGSVDQLPEDMNYDVVMTAFFWDMFSTTRALQMKASIDRQLKNETIWLLADFKNTGIWWQRTLLKAMYWFFRNTCDIEASQLPDFDQIFRKEHHRVLSEETFYYAMIQTTAYQSSGSHRRKF